MRNGFITGLIVCALASCSSDGNDTQRCNCPGFDEPPGEGAICPCPVMPQAPSDAAVACSTGPVYDEKTQFPQREAPDAGVVCTPHCGHDEHGMWALGTGLQLYKIAALPSGSCTPGTAPCDLDVGLDCNGRPYAIWQSFFCECASGSWTCSGVYKGGGICPP